MNAKRCISEYEYPDKVGLLFFKCPVCNEYIYHRDKSKIQATFIKETGYYDRTVYFRCNCGQIVYYLG